MSVSYAQLEALLKLLPGEKYSTAWGLLQQLVTEASVPLSPAVPAPKARPKRRDPKELFRGDIADESTRNEPKAKSGPGTGEEDDPKTVD